MRYKSSNSTVRYRRRSVFLCIPAIIIVLASCASPSQELVARTSAHADAADEFSDNTKTYVTKSEDEFTIKRILVQHLKVGYETFDLPLITEILADEFELRSLASKDEVVVDSKQNYLAARKIWEKSKKLDRQLSYSIRGLVADEERKSVVVVAASTYKSKYFSPRFIETLLFEKTLGRWMLKRQVMVPLSPGRPELYDVQIFVTKTRPQIWKSDFKRRLGKAPDETIDYYRQQSIDKVPSDNKARTVFFVFREPPPVGAKITITHSWWSLDATHPGPKHFNYIVQRSDPFFVIANQTWVGSGRGEIIFEVFLDGDKIAEKRVKT